MENMIDAAKNQVFENFTGKTFRFRCHKDISCFNECCAGLKLVLTPYDVLRLKNALNLTGGEFLEKFTTTSFDKGTRFPVITLKMLDDEKQTCPFVSEKGCTLYPDRPGACRIYPIGRASASLNCSSGGLKVMEKFFLVREKHCRGFEENLDWTISSWTAGEGVDEYNAVNDKWMEIYTSNQGMGGQSTLMKKIQMYMMACYNLEKFKDFIFKSSFFDHFEVSDELKQRIEKDQKELLLFALNWLKFSLFGEKTMKLSQ